MERDFLGLGDKKYICDLKHEDGVGEKGLSKEAAKQWGKGKLFGNSKFVPVSDFQEVKAFPGGYQWGSVSSPNVFLKGQFSGAFQNAQPLLLGGSVPLTTHTSLVPRVASSSPQLTIFYGGTVNVFNDISPEKAQAIMLCAGSGFTGENNMKKQVVREGEKVNGKQNQNAIAAASSSSNTPENFSRCRDNKHVATTNALSLIQSFNAPPGSRIPSVPQARKASLARFLEKRNERLISAMPYKKMVLDLSSGESSGMNYSST